MALNLGTIDIHLPHAGSTDSGVHLTFTPKTPYGDNPAFYVDQLDEILRDIRSTALPMILGYYPDRLGTYRKEHS